MARDGCNIHVRGNDCKKKSHKHREEGKSPHCQVHFSIDGMVVVCTCHVAVQKDDLYVCVVLGVWAGHTARCQTSCGYRSQTGFSRLSSLTCVVYLWLTATSKDLSQHPWQNEREVHGVWHDHFVVGAQPAQLSDCSIHHMDHGRCCDPTLY